MSTEPAGTQAILDRLERLERKLESRVIECRDLVLRYQDGKPMIILVEGEGGHAGMIVLDKNGAQRAALSVRPDGEPSLILNHPDEKLAIQFGILPDGMPFGIGLDREGEALWAVGRRTSWLNRVLRFWGVKANPGKGGRSR